MGYGKWISGAIGWALAGPIGGIIGFAVASVMEKDRPAGELSDYERKRGEERNSFLLSLLVLSSAVMKADGKIMKSELNYVRNFIERNFGPDAAREATIYLRDLLKKEVDIRAVGAQVANYMNHESRIQLLHYLTGIAMADGAVSTAEVRVLKEISVAMKIGDAESEAIFAMFNNGIDAAYKILEITPEASDDEIKRAYKTLAVRHHPDKVSHLGADVQKSAEERFKSISEAYEKIKKERGLS